MSTIRSRKKTTVQTFITKKANGEKITGLTAYDYFIAKLLDQAGIDIILVGDSAANVCTDINSTLPIPLEIMIAHTAAVSRGVERALVSRGYAVPVVSAVDRDRHHQRGTVSERRRRRGGEDRGRN